MCAGTAHANDALDKKLFLMGRALKNGDCGQALEVSEKLLVEFKEQPGPHALRARTELLCTGKYPKAWYHFAKYLEKGGERASVKDELEETLAKIGRVDLVINPRGGEIPADFDRGIKLQVPDGTAGIKDGPRHYRLAVWPGRHTFGMKNSRAGFFGQSTIEVPAGTLQNLTLEPKSPLFELTIRVESSQDTSGVVVKAQSDAVSKEVVLERKAPDVYGGLVHHGSVNVTIESQNPLISGAQLDVVGYPSEPLDKLIKLKTLEPAEMTVGTLDPKILIYAALPHGKTLSVKGDTLISTGSGEAKWSAILDPKMNAWEQSAVEHRFSVPTGRSSFPLPGAVELVSGGEVVHRQLLAPQSDVYKPITLTVPGAANAKDTFAVSLELRRPGQFERVTLNLDKVPAVSAYRASRELMARQRYVAGGAVGSAVLAGAAVILAGSYKTRAENELLKAADLSGASKQRAYDGYTSNAEKLNGRSNLWMGTAIGSGLVSAALGYYFFHNRRAIERKRAEYEQHRQVAYVP